MNFDVQYLEVADRILRQGFDRPNRTGVGTRALPAAMVQHDLALGFPLLTVKKTSFRSIAVELEGFLKGITDKRWYQRNGCTIWDEWCNPKKVPYGTDEETKARMREEPDLGPIYGFQWRSFGALAHRFGVQTDQLISVCQSLGKTPDSRRMVVSAWNPHDLPMMALPPCHVLWQVLVIDGRLHLNWYQRSADWFLGVPFNMASYALLASLLARQFHFEPGLVTGFFGDTHLYENQFEAAEVMLRREPTKPPTLKIPEVVNVASWSHTEASVENYAPHPKLTVEVVV